MGGWIIFLLLFAGIALLVAGAQSSRSSNQLRLLTKRQVKPLQAAKPATILERHARYRDPSDGMQERLIALMGGDRDAAEKVVARVRFAKPGKSEAYYWWAAVRQVEQQMNSSDGGM
jgi:hypothetical protein